MRADLAATLVTLAAAGLGACAGDPPTGIVLEISTDMRVPGEIDKLTINVRSKGRFLLARNYPLGEEPGRWTLPASVALTPAGPQDAMVSVEALAHLGGQVMVARTMTIPFTPGQVYRGQVELVRECRGVLCGAGKTCIPGGGCHAVSEPPGQVPPPKGPPCDCEDFFPMCVGATWTYEDVSFNTNVPTAKTYVVQDYGPIEAMGHDKWKKNGFVQFRVINGGLTRRWITVEGDAGRRRLYYEVDDNFDSQWQQVLSTYFVPAKLRLDGTRTVVGETWVTEHAQYDYRAHAPPDPVLTVKDRWMVVPVPLDLPARLREAFKDRELLCQKRTTGVLEDLPSVEQIYCFARGVGKIYDFTVGNDTERLTSYDVPGCGRSPR